MSSSEVPQVDARLKILGRRRGVASRVMSKAKASYDKAELGELFADAAPPTKDDVSVTNDGRRLDSAEAVIAFFTELREERAAEQERP